MAHGFGINQKAEELRQYAAVKGYDSQYRDDVVTIADITGLSVSVRVANGKYYMQGKRNEICSTKPDATMQRVAKAIDELKDKRNGEYT